MARARDAEYLPRQPAASHTISPAGMITKNNISIKRARLCMQVPGRILSAVKIIRRDSYLYYVFDVQLAASKDELHYRAISPRMNIRELISSRTSLEIHKYQIGH